MTFGRTVPYQAYLLPQSRQWPFQKCGAINRWFFKPQRWLGKLWGLIWLHRLGLLHWPYCQSWLGLKWLPLCFFEIETNSEYRELGLRSHLDFFESTESPESPYQYQLPTWRLPRPILVFCHRCLRAFVWIMAFSVIIVTNNLAGVAAVGTVSLFFTVIGIGGIAPVAGVETFQG